MSPRLPASLPFLATLTVALLAPACGGADGPSVSDDDGIDEPRPDAGDDATAPDATPPAPDAAVPDAAPPAPDAAVPDAEPTPSCSPWQVALDEAVPAGTTRTATIADGELTLSVAGDREGACSSSIEPCGAILLHQGRVSGDFDVSLQIASFDGYDLFDKVFLAVTTGGTSYAWYDRVALGRGTLLSLHHPGSYSGSESWSAGGAADHDAVLRIHREGSTLSLEATAGAATLTKSYPSGGDLEVVIGLEAIGSDTADPAEPVTAHIAGFTVTGGGGAVVSDEFDSACTLVSP